MNIVCDHTSAIARMRGCQRRRFRQRGRGGLAGELSGRGICLLRSSASRHARYVRRKKQGNKSGVHASYATLWIPRAAQKKSKRACDGKASAKERALRLGRAESARTEKDKPHTSSNGCCSELGVRSVTSDAKVPGYIGDGHAGI